MTSGLPNKRLKLAGAIALMETEWLRADERRLSSHTQARGGRVARSLSAIR